MSFSLVVRVTLRIKKFSNVQFQISFGRSTYLLLRVGGSELRFGTRALRSYAFPRLDCQLSTRRLKCCLGVG